MSRMIVLLATVQDAQAQDEGEESLRIAFVGLHVAATQSAQLRCKEAVGISEILNLGFGCRIYRILNFVHCSLKGATRSYSRK